MTIPASMPARAAYIGDGVTVNFPVPFMYFENTDGTKQIKVALADNNGENEVILTENIDFTITDAGEANGTLTTNVAPEIGKRLTIIFNIPIEQLTDYAEFGRLPSESIERALDKVTAILKQMQEELDRCVKDGISGTIDVDTTLNYIRRIYNSIDNVDVVAGDKTNIGIVAGNITKVNTVAENINNVNATGSSIASVNTVAGSISNVNKVASSIENVNITGTNIANVNNVGSNISKVNTVAGNIGSVKVTADNISDVVAATGAANQAASSAAAAKAYAQAAADELAKISETFELLAYDTIKGGFAGDSVTDILFGGTAGDGVVDELNGGIL